MKSNLFVALTIYYILTATNTFISSHELIPLEYLSFIVVIFVIFFYPQSLLNNAFYAVILYLLVNLIFLAFNRQVMMSPSAGDTPFRRVIIEFAFILPAISIFSVLVHIKDDDILMKIVGSFIISMLFTFFVTIPATIVDSSLLRFAALQIGQDTRIASTFSSFGFPSYTSLHSYGILFPVLIGLIKFSRGYRRWFWLIFFCLVSYIIVKSAITSLLITSLVSLIVLFLRSQGSKYFLLKFISVLSAGILTYALNIFERFIILLVSFYEGTSAEPKMKDLEAYYFNGSSSKNVDVRQSLHEISWMSFERSPIWGFDKVGGHSVLLDHLAASGILGFFPYMMIFFYVFFYWRKYINNTGAMLYYGLGLLVGVLLLSQKGLFGQEGFLTLFIFIPGLVKIIAVNLESMKVGPRNKKYIFNET